MVYVNFKVFFENVGNDVGFISGFVYVVNKVIIEFCG